MVIFFAVWAFLLDQVTKHWASLQGRVVLNQGISFGWLADLPSLYVTAIITLVAGAVVILVSRLHAVPVSLRGILIGGAVSNLADRVVYGGVRDWLPVPFMNLTNNLADYAVVLGILGLAIALFNNRHHV